MADSSRSEMAIAAIAEYDL